MEALIPVPAFSAAKTTLEVDIDGAGLWVPLETIHLKTGKALTHKFPQEFSAYWVRAISDTDTTAWYQNE